MPSFNFKRYWRFLWKHSSWGKNFHPEANLTNLVTLDLKLHKTYCSILHSIWFYRYFKINLPIGMGINRWDWKTGTYNVEFVAFHTWNFHQQYFSGENWPLHKYMTSHQLYRVIHIWHYHFFQVNKPFHAVRTIFSDIILGQKCVMIFR